jgi:glycerate 2-kinase
MLADRFMTTSLTDARILRILAAALDAVEPAHLVRRFLATAALPTHSRCYLLGLGKAAEAMTRGAAEAVGRYEDALVITKLRTSSHPSPFTILQAGHPVPDARSVVAGQAALDFVSRLEPTDLLICLVSGGGSALATAPVEGVTLEEIQAITSSALSCGAHIEDINNLRRCLDRIKGGGLAAATRAQILGIILSDVIGDRVEAVASGPTVPSRCNPAQAIGLLERIRSASSSALKNVIGNTTPHSLYAAPGRITNVIVGNARTAADGALQQAVREGFHSWVLEPSFQGEAGPVGRAMGQRLATEIQVGRRPACLIATGESTVTLSPAHGIGGRNQELALSAVESVGTLDNCMLVTLATDGEDGPTDAAGAVVTGATAARGGQLGMDSADYLSRHDAYHYFAALGDLLKPGYTGTNVNDLVVLSAL